MPKPEQIEIPGTERPKIKEIEKAAAKYVELRDQRMAVLKKECAAKESLIQVMNQFAGKIGRDGEDNLIYRFDDQVVTVSDKLQVKVRTAADETEPAGDE